MSGRYIFLFVALIFGCAGFRPLFQVNTELPFIINYPQPLKLSGTDHFEKYDFTEYTAGEDILQLKHYRNIPKQKALKMNEDRRYFILASFKDQPNPYPGVLSNSIGCPEELQPKAISDTSRVRLSVKLLATNNLVYGNCNVSDNFYYCAYLMFFCEAGNDYFELKIYTPIKNPSFSYENLVQSVQCK